MFKSLKLYLSEEISPQEISKILIEFGYSARAEISEEGDFTRRGEILDIFPVTFGCPVRVSFNFNKIESIHSVAAASGRFALSYQVVIILPKHKEYHRQITKLTAENPLNSFIELKKGGLVVHIKYGIGKYLGIQKIEGRDSFVLEYEKSEKLFVPVFDAHLIQKFIGIKGFRPKINRLGRDKKPREKGDSVLRL